MLLFLALLSLASGVKGSVTNCAPNSIFQITKLVLDPPEKAKVGENVTLTLLYTSPVEVDAGTITTSVTYNFLPLTPTKAPLCGAEPCPIEVGDHDGSSWFVVPTGLSGNVVTKIVWTDANAKELLCLNINMKASWF
jgi:hypothetical protein